MQIYEKCQKGNYGKCIIIFSMCYIGGLAFVAQECHTLIQGKVKKRVKSSPLVKDLTQYDLGTISVKRRLPKSSPSLSDYESEPFGLGVRAFRTVSPNGSDCASKTCLPFGNY